MMLTKDGAPYFAIIDARKLDYLVELETSPPRIVTEEAHKVMGAPPLHRLPPFNVLNSKRLSHPSRQPM